MVGVAQLVERWLVVPDVAGSSPVVHPIVESDAQWASDTSTVPDLQRVEHPSSSRSWVTIVWNDPVNLMSYVVYVFRSYFGFPRARAEELMLQVHNDGRAVVAMGSREEMERHVEAMHDFGLWASIQQAEL